MDNLRSAKISGS